MFSWLNFPPSNCSDRVVLHFGIVIVFRLSGLWSSPLINQILGVAIDFLRSLEGCSSTILRSEDGQCLPYDSSQLKKKLLESTQSDQRRTKMTLSWTKTTGSNSRQNQMNGLNATSRPKMNRAETNWTKLTWPNSRGLYFSRIKSRRDQPRPTRPIEPGRADST